MQNIVVKTKSDMAFEVLQEMILAGQIEEQRIYSIAEIEEMLGISRTPISKAVARLKEQGVIELVEKAGFKVLPLNSADIEEHSLLVTQLAKLVVSWVLERGQAQQVHRLQNTVDEIKKAILGNKMGKYFHETKNFYLGLCNLAQANVCKRFFENNWNYEGWYCYNLQNNQPALLELLLDHENLIAAIKAEDKSKAMAICDEHAKRCICILKKNAGGKTSLR